MKEPLKEKKYCSMIGHHGDIDRIHDCDDFPNECKFVFNCSSVKSAVEYREYLLNKQLDELEKMFNIKVNRKPFELTKEQAFPDLVFPNLQEKEGMTIKGSRTIRTDGI